MAFHSSCIALAQSLSADDVNRRILDFLLSQAVGRKNAKSWPKIEAHLVAVGAPKIPTKEAFQVGFLGKTRQGDEFIGSTSKGFFIIDSPLDAEATRRFYQHRIFVQMDRLRRLEALIEKEYPLD